MGDPPGNPLGKHDLPHNSTPHQVVVPKPMGRPPSHILLRGGSTVSWLPAAHVVRRGTDYPPARFPDADLELMRHSQVVVPHVELVQSGEDDFGSGHGSVWGAGF